MTVRITDHALIRWLDRAHGIDMEDMRARLAELAQPYAAAAVKHAFVGGVWFVFENGALVTVVENKPRPEAVCGNDRGGVNGTGGIWRSDPHTLRRHKMKKRRNK
jgi:hypothetical protein